MSSSVCYFNLSPVIDKTQPICYAVLAMWFLLLISLFDSTVVIKENSHLKKKIDNNECLERKWKLIFN